ncbi:MULTISPECIES: phosphogluconate dehydrogenase (NAD(+)-dependent, decarboxylating) [unclassified Enterococcus]|uniref:phosphogluconate dehydrogenase (NAD(+)-dependent, decarboxylating) n=1 Tax=unclassified Enterococcus TaxID=2608891 RepID=UPI0013EA7386|nr:MULTISPECIES: decarboxylating 6-phosphogluconate dehydrogenase [unclassified Enterococcus]
MEVGIIGLGKMGMNLALNLKEHHYQVKGMDVNPSVVDQAVSNGISSFHKLPDLIDSFEGTRIIWLMLPAGEITEMMLGELRPLLEAGDIVIEGGNSHYKDSIRRAAVFQENEIGYLDCGTSGGISGARSQACLMIGGKQEIFESVEQLFKDTSAENGYLYAGASGSGHYLKMVHNGIEYGMMQAIGEGFQLIQESDYSFDLEKVARVWNNGSVIRSWLMEIMEEQFKQQPNLEEYKGVAASSGEAQWTVETALEQGTAVPVIALSLFMRNLSQEEDSFSLKVVSALRNGFGGHEIVKK